MAVESKFRLITISSRESGLVLYANPVCVSNHQCHLCFVYQNILSCVMEQILILKLVQIAFKGSFHPDGGPVEAAVVGSSRHEGDMTDLCSPLYS